MIENRWDDAHASRLDDSGRLTYRSNLLGGDRRITNFGGGNTSAKLKQEDPLTGEAVEALWVKGSGGDLGSIDRSGFATLSQDRLLGLERRYRGREHEDEMVPLFPLCRLGDGGTAPSIDTPLHAFVPHAHVDHMHPDSVIAIAAARDGERLTREVYGDDVGWLPWQRPGFDLGLSLRNALLEHPQWRGVVLGGHGLISWGDTSRACYENTLDLIRRAEAWLAKNTGSASFGGPAGDVLTDEARRAYAAHAMPLLRGRVSGTGHKVGHFVDLPEVLEFTSSKRFEELAALGTSCPDHFLRTKIRPLVLPSAIETLEAALDKSLEAYRAEYTAYYERNRVAGSPAIRDASPVVFLVPGVGMITFASDKKTARVAAEFYTNAIAVMRGACAVDEYVGLDEREAFGIEYWPLEQAKLDRLPPPPVLRGRVALITGGAGGIGKATARRLLLDGACVVLLDIDAAALEEAGAALREAYGADLVRTVVADVTDEGGLASAFEYAVVEYGGLDLLVSNTGVASSAPIEETSLETWNRNMDVLATGYFLAAREAFCLLKRQGNGGSIVFVASKNALVASPGASAYSAAKSAELHLARCLALEGAPDGIRVNSVNPDAVLNGSKIWNGSWRTQRAAAHGIAPEELDEFYRKRSLLQLTVTPEDVAEAVHFFASDRSSRSTGNVLNVDAGNASAFPR